MTASPRIRDLARAFLSAATVCAVGSIAAGAAAETLELSTHGDWKLVASYGDGGGFEYCGLLRLDGPSDIVIGMRGEGTPFITLSDSTWSFGGERHTAIFNVDGGDMHVLPGVADGHELTYSLDGDQGMFDEVRTGTWLTVLGLRSGRYDLAGTSSALKEAENCTSGRAAAEKVRALFNRLLD